MGQQRNKMHCKGRVGLPLSACALASELVPAIVLPISFSLFLANSILCSWICCWADLLCGWTVNVELDCFELKGLVCVWL